jgi:hypothetical protein
MDGRFSNQSGDWNTNQGFQGAIDVLKRKKYHKIQFMAIQSLVFGSNLNYSCLIVNPRIDFMHKIYFDCIH